tara:strand:- start:2554 stop:2946 length:393 start_codon:yes stop_codon:yes gene_type:complete
MEDKRPLSPHLQVYKWQISMFLSILHRASGTVLGLGTLLLAYWLISIAMGPEVFSDAQCFLGSIFGRIILFGFTAALILHFLNGVRHLFWDAGYGFELSTSKFSGWIVFLLTILLTILVWVLGYLVRGDI